jgi:hypothetical protein
MRCGSGAQTDLSIAISNRTSAPANSHTLELRRTSVATGRGLQWAGKIEFHLMIASPEQPQGRLPRETL